MTQIFSKLALEFTANASSLYTEVFVENDTNHSIDKHVMSALHDAYFTISDAFSSFDDNAICIEEFVEIIDQSIVKLMHYKDANKFVNSAIDLYTEASNELRSMLS